jgi:hypothetical protein
VSIRSELRLLPVAALIVVLGLTFAPASFAGENDNTPGPTKVGEVAGPQGPAGAPGPAGSQGPAGPQGGAGSQGAAGSQGPAGPEGSAGPQGPAGPQGSAGKNGKNGKNGSSGGVLGTTFATQNTPTATRHASTHGVLGVETTLARGGVQAGAGGMAVASSPANTIPILLAGGGVLLLVAAGSGLVPARRRSNG